MLRKLRILLAALFFTGITLLFLDFSGVLHAYLGWMAKLQMVPALLWNWGLFAGLLLLTLIFGRFYCSVLCPLGVFQDIVSWFSGLRKHKKKRYRFGYKKGRTWLRLAFFLLFLVALLAGIGSVTALLEPYGAYGRMAQNLFSPVYRDVNNLLAMAAERTGSYAFYTKDVWIKSLPTFIIACATLVLVVILAWKGGRTYCNTVCPVGSLLGWLNRRALMRVHIDTGKCNGCGLCGLACKASCIDTKAHKIDYSRCVNCMDCLENCKQKAISFRLVEKAEISFSLTIGRDDKKKTEPDTGGENVDTSRRSFLTGVGVLAGATAVRAAEKKVDGGLAVIEDKKIPERTTPIVPPGAQSLKHFRQHCVGCQLCVAACPNDVLRPSSSLLNLMQPECSYEKGYCRPECTKCSEVCPTGAIKRITREEKTAIQTGHAVWVKENCVVLTDQVECGNCARHCPAWAIHMVPSVAGDPTSPKIPAIHEENCIGCGACENLCPARPFSAIYVEGHEVHRMK